MNQNINELETISDGTLPTIFHIAPRVASFETHLMGKLLMRAWMKRNPAWKQRTTYFEARTPPPLAPPVPRRMITLSKVAKE